MHADGYSNDDFGLSSGPAPSPPAPSPPAPSPPAPMDQLQWDSVTSVEAPPAPPAGGSSQLPWIAAVGATVLLLGGGAFFALSAVGASGGAASPDEGIEAVLGAAGNEDFVTLAELLEPSERRTLAEPAITELLPELVRLGLLEDSVDAGDVDGLDLVFTDVEYRVERLVGVDDIAHVFLTGGEFAANVNSADLPFTSEVDTTDFDQQEQQTITESETPIVFVERDGNWYFSLWFTIAENTRLELGERLPSPDESPTMLPSESPEAAIEGMFESMTSLDLERLIGHIDPEEMAVLYRYSPLFLNEAQAELDTVERELQAEGFEWDITNFDFDVDQDGDDATVTVRGFTVEVVADGLDFSATYGRDEITGQYDLDGMSFDLSATTTDYAIEGQIDDAVFDAVISIEPQDNRVSGTIGIEGESFDGNLMLDPAGECSSFEITGSDGTEESGCLEEAMGVSGLGPLIEAMEDWPTEFPGVAMRTRQVDGGWYISPTSTVFDGVINSLEELEAGDFEDVFDPFGGVFDEFVTDPVGAFDDTDPWSDDSFGDSEFDDELFDDEVFTTSADPELEEQSFIEVQNGEVGDFTGAINSNGFDSYVVNLDADERVTVTAEAQDFGLDTTLRIIGPTGDEIAFNDDADPFAELSSSFDSQVIFTPETSGTYVLEVAGFGDSSGGYVIVVDRESDEFPVEGDDPVQPSPVAAAPIDIDVPSGETMETTGTVAAPATYLLPADAGDKLVITVEAANPVDLDPVVTLFFNNDQVAQNDDAADATAVADSFDSQLIVTVGDTGVHEIVIDGFAGSTGDYTMTIERN